MEHTVEEILTKLNLAQLKGLIALYGLEKPHSKSSKSDYVAYIQTANIALDPRMLVNYFGLTIKPKRVSKTRAEAIADISSVDMSADADDADTSVKPEIKKRSSRSPERRRRSSRK